MAEEFTILPEFVQNELNTQVITQDDLPQRMIEANAHRWQMNQLAQQQSKEELNDQLTNMNYDTAGVWDVDLPEINNDIKGFVEWIKQNPNALLKKADNLELYQQMMQKRNDILYKIGKSKADKVIYEKQQTFIEDPKNIDYQTPNNAMILNKFYSKDGASSLMDRKWTGFAPPDTWDERSVIEYGRNKIIKTTSLNATTDYTPDTEVMGYIGTVLNTPSLANPFMHHYQSEYNMMLGNNPNQEIEVFDQESIIRAINLGLEQISLVGGYCPKYNRYMITGYKNEHGSRVDDPHIEDSIILNASDRFTVMWNMDKQYWEMFTSYIPEYYSYMDGSQLGTLMVTFRYGVPYYHNKDSVTTYNTFYGYECNQVIEVVSNQYPQAVKNWVTTGYDSDYAFEIESMTTSIKQQSQIPISAFVKKEGTWWSNFYRDITSSGSLLEGSQLKGTWVKLKLVKDRNNKTKYNELRRLFTNFTTSDKTLQ